MTARLIAATLLVVLLSTPARAQEAKTALSTEDLELAKEMDAEYQRLAAAETPPVLAKLGEAKAHLDPAAGAWAHREGIATLRKIRSRAGVPLLLRTLLLRAQEPPVRREAGFALTLLTGKSVPDLWSSDLNATTKLARDLRDAWWPDGKDAFVTDLEKMPEDALAGVVRQLIALESPTYRLSDTADPKENAYVDQLVFQSRDTPTMAMTFDEELSECMVPRLTGDATIKDRRYPAARLLGRIRAKGGAPVLDAIVKDKSRGTAVRLACVLALARAGEGLRTPLLLEMLEAEKDLEMRLGIIVALADAPEKDLPAALPIVSALLGDPDRCIRLAALHAIAAYKPRSETERLEKLLKGTDDLLEARWTMKVLIALRTPEARDVLGRYLKSTLEPSPFHDAVRNNAVDSLAIATGNRWLEAGPHDPAYYFAQAKKAVEWWEANKGK